MNWLPPPQDFRGRLAAAGGRPGALVALANTLERCPCCPPHDAPLQGTNVYDAVRLRRIGFWWRSRSANRMARGLWSMLTKGEDSRGPAAA